MNDTSAAVGLTDEAAVPPRKEIKLGLAMSGAISAGAYSAGVVDFLIEALDEWEKARHDPSLAGKVPQHRVVIAAMSGASAGAITSSLGTLAAGVGPLSTSASGDFMDLTPPEPEAAAIWRAARKEQRVRGQDAFRVLPELYDAWVKGPKFVAAVGDPVCSLLNSADLDEVIAKYSKDVGTINEVGKNLERAPLKSLLNADGLMQIGRVATGRLRLRYEQRRDARPLYLAENLHLFLTQANLRGIPYSVKVGAAASPEYGMMAHADRAHYLLQGVGGAAFDSVWAKQDFADVRFVPGGESAALPAGLSGSTPEPLWKELNQTFPNETAFLEDTLASGAYPVGLAARSLNHNVLAFEQRAWTFPQLLGRYANIKPDWGGRKPAARYVHAAVDGGSLNNDPIEYMRYTLAADPDQLAKGDSHRSKVDSIVMMISPFPDKPKMGALDHGKADLSLGAVAAGAISMFVQQSRFKIEEILRALDTRRADLWRVSPTREGKDNEHEPYAIACGLFGGFGGFLDIEFRRHDYELGRRNCQALLKFWFGLPKDNPHIDAVEELAFKLREGETETLYPIIPLFGSAAEEVKVRDWPSIREKEYWGFIEAAATRGGKLADYLFKVLGVPSMAVGLVKQFKNPESLVRTAVVGKTFPELLERGNIVLAGPDDEVAAERRVLDIVTRRTLGPYLAAKLLYEQMPERRRGDYNVRRLYAELEPLVLNELSDENIAGLAEMYDVAPAVLESIIDAAPPAYRIVPTLTEELNLAQPEAPLSEDRVTRLVNRLIERKLLAEPDDSVGNALGGGQWDPKNKVWRNKIGRLMHTAYPAYRFVGRGDSETTCA